MTWFKRVTLQLTALFEADQQLTEENARLTAEVAAVQEINARLMGDMRSACNQATAAFQRCERLESRLGRLEGRLDALEGARTEE